MLKSTWILILGLLLCSIAFAADEPLQVFVSIAPQAAFVEKIAGDRAEVHVLVAPGESPATYSPSPRQMVRLAKADVFLRIGVPFETGLIPKVKQSMPQLKIVDTRKGVELREMESAQEDGHHDHKEHGHHHGPKDPHIWLDPVRVKTQARTIAETLIELDSKGEEHYRKNLTAFEKELDQLDERIRNALADLKVRKLFVFHPSYGYFCERYDLEQIAFEVQGKEPSGKELTNFIKMAKKDDIKVIFIQPQFSDTAARTIAKAIGGAVVTLDPLARNYTHNLQEMAEKVKKALEKKTPDAEDEK
jgi:zinc transport system substrate-binding protein